MSSTAPFVDSVLPKCYMAVFKSPDGQPVEIFQKSEWGTRKAVFKMVSMSIAVAPNGQCFAAAMFQNTVTGALHPFTGAVSANDTVTMWNSLENESVYLRPDSQ